VKRLSAMQALASIRFLGFFFYINRTYTSTRFHNSTFKVILVQVLAKVKKTQEDLSAVMNVTYKVQ
jgi:hypothetical protein